MKSEDTFRLSKQAFEEFKKIVEEEIDTPMIDEEIEAMGIRLLRLFKLLVIPLAQEMEPDPLNAKEQEALKFINTEKEKGRFPSIRELTKAIGLKSSRSGYRVLKRLNRKGYASRDNNLRLKTSR